MANLTETPIYDAGIYQLETADPVAGGTSGTTSSSGRGGGGGQGGGQGGDASVQGYNPRGATPSDPWFAAGGAGGAVGSRKAEGGEDVKTEIWVRHTSSASSHQVRHRWQGLLSPMALSFVAPLFERPL